MIRILVIFLLMISWGEAVVTLGKKADSYQDFTLEYYIDHTKKLPINVVKELREFSTLRSGFNLGYDKSVLWIKITLENNSENDAFVLSFNEPIWEHFDLYRPVNGGYEVDKNGLDVPLEKRSIEDVNPAFELHIPQGESKTYYLRTQTVSGQLGAFTLFTKEAFFKPMRFGLTTLYLIYFVILVVMLLLNLFLFYNKHNSVYLYYLAYLVSFVVWLHTVSGLYLVYGLDGWKDALHATGTLVVLTMVLFSAEFLELKSRLPSMYAIFRAFAIIFGIFFIAISVEIEYSSLLFNIFSSIFFMILLIVAVKVWLSGHMESRYYLLAVMFYMPTMAMMTMTFNGFIEYNDVNRYAFIAGSLVEILFFNSLMVRRYAKTMHEKNSIQQQLLEEREASGKRLEREVVSRTLELKEANEKLVTYTKALEETKDKLIKEATTDTLTGLYNRRYFNDMSKQYFLSAKDEKSRLTLIIIRIEAFKMINDQYGHNEGDKVLQHCAQRIKEHVASDCLAARLSGNEFAILAYNKSSDFSDKLATLFNEAVKNDKVELGSGGLLSYQVRLGSAEIVHEDDKDIMQLLKRADAALSSS